MARSVVVMVMMVITVVMMSIMMVVPAHAVEIKWIPGEGEPPEPYSARRRAELVSLFSCDERGLVVSSWRMMIERQT